jgi:hypothetical protein
MLRERKARRLLRGFRSACLVTAVVLGATAKLGQIGDVKISALGAVETTHGVAKDQKLKNIGGLEVRKTHIG